MLGIDVDGLLAGCAAMDKRCAKAGLMENPAYLRATVQFLMDTKKGKNMSVMMPYADGLKDVAAAEKAARWNETVRVPAELEAILARLPD